MIASRARGVWELTWTIRIKKAAVGWLRDAFHREARSEYLKMRKIACVKVIGKEAKCFAVTYLISGLTIGQLDVCVS